MGKYSPSVLKRLSREKLKEREHQLFREQQCIDSIEEQLQWERFFNNVSEVLEQKKEIPENIK